MERVEPWRGEVRRADIHHYVTAPELCPKCLSLQGNTDFASLGPRTRAADQPMKKPVPAIMGSFYLNAVTV